jgi:hypothetical protein
MKYTKTIKLDTFANIPASTKPGQWVQQADGVRGQYMGTTRAGVQVMHYNATQHPQRIRNSAAAALRGFAVRYSSK